MTAQISSEIKQLYYFNARWMNPDTGRFITEDPIRDGLLWAAFVNNNPMGFVDRNGFQSSLPGAPPNTNDFDEIAKYFNGLSNSGNSGDTSDEPDVVTSIIGKELEWDILNNQQNNGTLSILEQERLNPNMVDLQAELQELYIELTSDLLLQTDPSLNPYDGSISRWGCAMRAQEALMEIESILNGGTQLTSEEINAIRIIGELDNFISITPNNGGENILSVRNPNPHMQLAADVLGLENDPIHIGNDQRLLPGLSADRSLTSGTIIRYETANGGPHYVAGDRRGNPIFNPDPSLNLDHQVEFWRFNY